MVTSNAALTGEIDSRTNQTCIPKGYKRTEAGVIPSDWRIRSVKQIGTPVRGGSPRPAGDPRYFNGSYISWLTVAGLTNISPSQLFVTETEAYLTKEGALRSRTLMPGTLIIANSGATLGVAKILGIKCCANDGVAAILNSNKDVSLPYIAHFINSKTNYLRQIVATGNGQPNLNTGLIGDFNIPFPPTKTEQETIAEALNDADALIESLDQLIVKKRQIKQGAMQELLAGRKRLPGFNGTWEVKRLGDLASLYQPVTISAKQFTETGYPVYGANGVVGFYDKFNHEEWQVAVTCRGSTCGTVNKTVDRCWITGNAMVVNCAHKDISKDFLYYLLLSQDLSVCITGTGQPQIVRAPLAALEVRLPPGVAEQSAIANVLSDMDSEISVLETKLAKARQIKQGMMQELLTGRIRLV